jgi:hypothetical protein
VEDKECCGRPSISRTDKSVEMISELIHQEGISLFTICEKKINLSYGN